MQMKPEIGLHAGSAFGVLAAAFVIAFGIAVVPLAVDLQRVIAANDRLQTQTMPEIVRYQRLSRNLEQLRQEGERIFAAGMPAARQQSMFIVTLVASHPSVLADPASAQLAREAEQFLGEVVRQASTDGRRAAGYFDEWQRLATRLGVQVDEVSVQGVNLIGKDLELASESMKLARFKLMIALGVAGAFLIAFMVLVRRHLIGPLQRIDKALSNLSIDQPRPVFRQSLMLEIQSVEEAICEHHDLLLQNEEVRRALETLANKDGLTGLMNRRHFMQVAEVELQRAQRYRRAVTVGMADLDYFKKLNDTYGHAAGDAVLRAIADLMQEALRQSDMVCRYGGEEFAFLFPEIPPAEAAKLAERLRASCADTQIGLPDGRSIKVTISIGLADASECPIEIALRRADEALYDAKHLGRNKIVVSGDAWVYGEGEPEPRTGRLF